MSQTINSQDRFLEYSILSDLQMNANQMYSSSRKESNIDCGTNCAWKWGSKKECQRKRDCACECGQYGALNPNIKNSCVQMCNSSKPLAVDDFLCQQIGGETLYNMYGLNMCGYSFEESAQYQSWQQQTDQKEEIEEKSRGTQNAIMAGLGVLVLVLVLKLLDII